MNIRKNEGIIIEHDGLKEKIRRAFKSQIAFAHHIGEQDSLVSKVVKGWRSLPIEKQEKWAKALKCKRSELF